MAAIDYKIKQIDMGNGNIVERIDYFSEHWYSIPGIEEKLKSVTTILAVIAKGYQFDEWLKTAGVNADYIARKAADSGCLLHNAIEQMIYGNTIRANYGEQENYTKKEWQKLNDWYSWYSWLVAEHKLEPIAVEKIVYSERIMVAGTADLICKINDEVWLLDWKTGNSIHSESNMQVAIYAYMYNQMIDKGIFEGEKITKCGVVHVGAKNKGNAKGTLHNKGIKVAEVDNWQGEVRNFYHTLKVFNRKNPNIKAPIDEFPMELGLEKGILKLEKGDE